MTVGTRERPATALHARRLTVSLPQLWAIVCLGGIFIILSLQLIHPHDFWWHVRVGQWIVENRRLPDTDLFSFTRAGAPYGYQMWLMQVVLYSLFHAGGPPLVIIVQAVAITGAYWLLLRVNCRACAGDLRWASLATFAAAVIGVTNWNVRPQTVSFLLVGLTMYLLDRDAAQSLGGDTPHHKRRLVWWLPLLFVVWANAHGGFVFGLALVGAALGARLVAWMRRQSAFPARMALSAAASAGTTLLTPLGPRMLDYVLGFVRHPVTRSLNTEFMPPTIQTTTGQLFFGFAAILIVLVLASHRRPTTDEAVRLLVFGVLALMAVRNVVWFGFAATPTMAASIARLAADRRRRQSTRAGRQRINLALAGMIALVVAFSLPWFRPWLPLPSQLRGYVSSDTPVEGVDFLRALPSPRRVFHSESFGSYMIWASPEVPVFIDTRVELYPPSQWYDYLALGYARHDWETILERYGVDTLLLERGEHDQLIEAASRTPGWNQSYADEQAVIFERETVQ